MLIFENATKKQIFRRKKWAKIILQKIHGFCGFLNSFEEF